MGQQLQLQGFPGSFINQIASQVVLQSLFSERPEANGTNQNLFHLATDTGVLSNSNGITWSDVVVIPVFGDTTITGFLHQSGGDVSLNGNAASYIITSAGALNLTGSNTGGIQLTTPNNINWTTGNGDIVIKCGNGLTTDGGGGGTIYLTAGQAPGAHVGSGRSAGAAGRIIVITGSGGDADRDAFNTSSPGGILNVQTGNGGQGYPNLFGATNPASQGGDINFVSGNGGSSNGYGDGAVGGAIVFHAGTGGGGSGALNPGEGGYIELLAGPGGAGGTGDANGAYVSIQGGVKHGSGADGVIGVGDVNASVLNIGNSGSSCVFAGSVTLPGGVTGFF